MNEQTLHPPLPEAPRVLCERCGTTGGTSAPLTWMCALEQGAHRYYCERCARAHIRAIEGRLDPDSW
ncbi:hypothetical protein OG233_09995 [Streptomyces sp. NBC_01218]|uniref:hypothetical protein n=1 Tax=unclassified Streptomyces TaxID=2593676 RepID=UPI0023B9B6F7|nr:MULTISPECIES: hypothetical protein [unclassified Streptomyces]WEH39790.1 hypothetical protein PZB77_09825 [Streptomyces sp. AM 2-1-1]WSQ51481.1 hypothetical protein OG233_09995 [Streptomyces sp. NBC_01218]